MAGSAACLTSVRHSIINKCDNKSGFALSVSEKS